LNEHVEKYCLSYITSKLKPDFALLIKGEWGCGKTYFINSVINKLKKNNKINDNEIASISLFGVSTLKDLEEKIYQALHPILSSPQVEFVSALIRSALKMGINMDFTGDGKSNASLTIGGIKNRKLRLDEFKKKLFIIDDLERCELNLSIVLGYFLELIIKSKLKVIFIGNETQIIDEKYPNIKEKIIGLEFLIKPDIEKAMRTFINELSFSEYKDDIYKISLNVINILNCENLRNIRQCFYNLKILLNTINQINAKFEENYLLEILQIYILLSLQKIQGDFSNYNDVNHAIICYKIHGSSLKNYKVKNGNTDKALATLNTYKRDYPLANCWEKIILDGDYTLESIKLNYEMDIKPPEIPEREETKTLIYFLNSWRDMDKSEFKETIDLLKKEFEDGIYLHPGEILLYAFIICYFIESEVIDNKKKGEIEKEVLNFINNNSDKISVIKDWGMFYSYAGFEIPNKEYIKSIKEKLYIINIFNLYKQKKIELENLTNSIENDINPFLEILEREYFNIPVLSLIEPKSLFDKLNELKISEQQEFIRILKRRYINNSTKENYKVDIDNINKLKKLYEDEIKENPKSYNPRAVYQEQIVKDLDEIHKKLSSEPLHEPGA
jgi:DNA polymerase III delta prime subunit